MYFHPFIRRNLPWQCLIRLKYILVLRANVSLWWWSVPLIQNEYRRLIFSKFWVGIHFFLSCFPSNKISFPVYIDPTILSLFERIIFTRDFLLENGHLMTAIVSITKCSSMSGSFINKTALICGLIDCFMSKLFYFTCPIISTQQMLASQNGKKFLKCIEHWIFRTVFRLTTWTFAIWIHSCAHV